MTSIDYLMQDKQRVIDFIEKQTNDHDIAYITEEENKAIQKKIEELKENK